MNLTFRSMLIVPATILSLGMVVPGFAQSNPSASDSMHAAGESMEQAGSNTADAAKQAYRGTATAARDMKITAKVKAALHSDEVTEKSEIDVSTTAGVVTLKGQVSSTAVAKRAKKLAKSTEDVRRVNSELVVTRAAASD